MKCVYDVTIFCKIITFPLTNVSDEYRTSVIVKGSIDTKKEQKFLQ